MDYGNSENVKFNMLAELHKDLVTIPAQVCFISFVFIYYWRNHLAVGGFQEAGRFASPNIYLLNRSDHGSNLVSLFQFSLFKGYFVWPEYQATSWRRQLENSGCWNLREAYPFPRNLESQRRGICRWCHICHLLSVRYEHKILYILNCIIGAGDIVL